MHHLYTHSVDGTKSIQCTESKINITINDNNQQLLTWA